MKNPYFTIFTSVFNGEKHIHRVFESLVSQTFKDFEWIVVNDGSTDNTSKIIRSFIEFHPELSIVFIEQEKSGKHFAWNKAIKQAKGFFLVPVDADDYFLPESLSFFYESWNRLSPEEQSDLSGINVLCFDNDNDKIVGKIFPYDGIKTNNLELDYKYKIKGDKWGCIRLDLLRDKQFPTIKGKYYPEAYLWYELSKNYKALYRYYTTYSGITQTELNRSSSTPSKIRLKYNLWLLRNFGLYILGHSPKDFFLTSASIVKHSILSLR
jgi:glycosyltransferase involved in cell wall biosynthesis